MCKGSEVLEALPDAGCDGPLIVLEGPDGSGKTTCAGLVAELLKERGWPVDVLRMPGGTRLGELLRGPLKDSSYEMSPAVKAALFLAVDPAGHEAAERATRQGRAVVMDRCALSNLAYRWAQREDAAAHLLEGVLGGAGEAGGGSGHGLGMRWLPMGARVVFLDAPNRVLQERVAAGKDTARDRFDGLWLEAARAYRVLAGRLRVPVVDSSQGGPIQTARAVLRACMGAEERAG